MARFLPKEYNRVLEIGCASGGFSDQLPKAREIWGVEPFDAAARTAATKLTRVLIGTYEQVSDNLPDNHFDLVICNDVIEHMSDHDAFLHAIRRKVAPNAYLIGSIPNIRHITALAKLLVLRDWPYADSGILDRTHLRFFTRKSLKRTLTTHGFQVERVEGIDSVIRCGFVSRDGAMSPIVAWVLRLVTLAVVIGTVGYYNDTQYPQYAFRARF